jgi:hypothetical protein
VRYVREFIYGVNPSLKKVHIIRKVLMNNLTNFAKKHVNGTQIKESKMELGDGSRIGVIGGVSHLTWPKD